MELKANYTGTCTGSQCLRCAGRCSSFVLQQPQKTQDSPSKPHCPHNTREGEALPDAIKVTVGVWQVGTGSPGSPTTHLGLLALPACLPVPRGGEGREDGEDADSGPPEGFGR